MPRGKKTNKNRKGLLRKSMSSLQNSTKKFFPKVKQGIEGVGAKVVPTAKSGFNNLFGLLKMPKRMPLRKSRKSRKSRK